MYRDWKDRLDDYLTEASPVFEDMRGMLVFASVTGLKKVYQYHWLDKVKHVLFESNLDMRKNWLVYTPSKGEWKIITSEFDEILSTSEAWIISDRAQDAGLIDKDWMPIM